MKKETLYEIYDCIDDVEFITNNLDKLSKISNITSNIFLSFCKNGLVNKHNIRLFLDLSNDIEYSMLGYQTEGIVNSINEVLVDDYVRNDTDYDSIIDNYAILLQNSMDYIFMVDTEEELAYYKALTIYEFNRYLKNYKNFDINKIYNHDLCEIIDAYNHVLEDLPNTKSNNTNIDFNAMLVKRIKYFIDLISDKDIYERGKEKYKKIVEIASKTDNIEDLKRLKNRIKLNRTLELKEFESKIDDDNSDFNDVTVNLVYEALGIKKIKLTKPKKTVLLRSFNDKEKEREIIKKVLKPENNA